MNFIWIACLMLAQELYRNVVYAAGFTAGTLPIDKPEDEQLDLVAINGRDFLNNITKDITGKPWHDDREQNYIIRCLRPAKCERIQTNTCFGGRIPYKFTSGQLSEEGNQEHNLKKLALLEALQNVPKCWEVIQPFLCAVYLPKCTRIKGKDYVYLPSYEMCQVTVEPCRILYKTDFFPSYLKCDEKVFPCKNCSNDVRDMKFTTISSQCVSPLVATDSAINYFPDIEGCGLQCKDPMYTDNEHESVQTLIFWGAIMCFIFNFFVIATFLIHDWKHSKHPAWNLFYISICFLCNWIGWMLQFFPGHRENIVCRRDGTLRYSEPSAGDNLACIIPFILIYYFLIAANVWFAIFTYAWYLQTKDRGSIRDRIDKESFYFHFIAWALPFILTVSIMVLSEVDGNSITGICFVGYRNRAIRNGLVLVPVAILTFGVSVFFSFKGGLNLNRIKRSTSSIDESKKLNSHILGMCFRTMLVVFFILVFFIFETYEVRNTELWTKSLNDFIICKIRESHLVDVKCKIHNRPSIAVLQLRLLCLFCVNLVISSWCWTWPALKTWKRFVKKKIGYELSEDEKFTKPKHRIIADAYAKRGDEVISVSIENSHTDPAGLNFDVNNLYPAESDGMSATLTNYLPSIINRRNAVTWETMEYDEQNANYAPYASSCADNNSEISVSVRHFSVESRRNSIDSQISQVSVKMSETNIKATLESHSQKHKSVNMKTKKRQHNYMIEKRTNRRASSSSVESQRITNQMKHIKYKYPNHIQVNDNPIGRQNGRRSAISATADIDAIKQLMNRCNLKLTSEDDDDRSIDGAVNTQDPSNMLVPFGAHPLEPAHSTDSLEISNEKKEPSIEQLIHKILKNSNEEELKSLRRSFERSNERTDYGSSKMGKKDRNSMKNSKNQRNSHSKKYSQQKNDEAVSSKTKHEKEPTNSNSSSIEIGMIAQLNGTQSSFSDQSMNRMKTQSRNSKDSCDVGIQANDYDITSHTRNRSHSRDDCDKDYLPEKLQSHYHKDEECTEMHQLLPLKKRDQPTIQRKNTNERTCSNKHLSESKKLKKLLLP